MTQRRRPGPKGTLSRQTILDAAQTLLSSGGAGAVTVRGVAAQVGVAPNAVYTYFSDKAAVQRALVERLLGEVDLGGLNDRTRPWRQRLRSLAVDMRTRLLSHPGAVSLLLAAPMNGPHAKALGERLLDVFTDAGLKPEDAARACHLVLTYALGSIALEAAQADQGRALPSENERAATRLQYIWGLDRLCDGLSIQLVATHPDSYETAAPTAVPD